MTLKTLTTDALNDGRRRGAMAGRLIRTLLCLTALATLLSGCADQRIRSESDRLMHDNHYEQAYDLLEGGLKQYPDSMLLRSGSLQARNAALNRLLDDAASARAEGALDEAEALLQRAKRFDPSGRSVSTLLAELAVERKQRAALAEAEDLAFKKKPDAALRVLAEALKDNARQPDLLALQRRLQGEQRRIQAKAAQLGLSETRPISLDFRDANLRTVLDVVTRNSGVNFVLDKDIKPDVRVTVFLRSARVEDAIDLIVSTHQLAKKVIDEQTLLIYPNTPEKQREYQEQVVRVFYLANAEAKGAAAFLKSMLRAKDPFVDERSNMLALRDTPEMIEMAERLITLYDTADAEVVLELEVLEIRTNRLLELGVQFPDSLTLTPLAPSTGSGSSTGGSGLTVSNLNRLGWDRVGVGINGLLVNLKRQVGDVNTLANPRIRVRSKDKAKVLIGDKVPIVSATTGQTGFVSDSVSYLDVGLKLDVEPTVYADDDVAIKIGLEVSSIASQVTTKSGSLAYQIGTRSASTVLRLRDGETQLLAGLISRDERSSANRIPGLGDLPLAGRLFGSQRDEAVRTELVLAITPRVVRNMRRPEISESELWVGTELSPRIRGVGGLVSKREVSEGGASVASTPSTGPTTVGLPTAAPDAPAVVKPGVSLRWQGPAQARVGEVFSVALDLDSGSPIRGLPLQVKFSQSQLELVDVEEGEYFKGDGSPTSFTKAVDAGSGVVRAGVLRNQAKGATGQGPVVRLKFKALKPGAAEVSLMAADPIALGNPLPPTPLPPLLRVNVQ